MPHTFRTKPTGIHATFETDCFKCGATVTVSNGRPDYHRCEQPVSLDDIRLALDNRSN